MNFSLKLSLEIPSGLDILFYSTKICTLEILHGRTLLECSQIGPCINVSTCNKVRSSRGGS